ncbi:MAG: sigma-70 family RNA polymerase sigma factor [Clostridia bacterium]|jgi:DNA-directed RNA polymerase specialized sigma24 family protein|nr:sigma-70 family RNA polymerase sigma factor [Clostridia bacterium]
MMSNYEFEDDVTLAKFINYMQKALYHRRLNYFRDFKRMREWEVSINEIEDCKNKYIVTDFLSTNILNDKEMYLLNLHYNHGLTYTEISKITNEKVCTLKQRRNRAIAKLKRKVED